MAWATMCPGCGNWSRCSRQRVCTTPMQIPVNLPSARPDVVGHHPIADPSVRREEIEMERDDGLDG